MKSAFEPFQNLSSEAINAYKDGLCDEDSEVGQWLEGHRRVTDWDFSPLLFFFLQAELAPRVFATTVLWALHDERFPEPKDAIYDYVQCLSLVFQQGRNPTHVIEPTWFTSGQRLALKNALRWLMEQRQWREFRADLRGAVEFFSGSVSACPSQCLGLPEE